MLKFGIGSDNHKLINLAIQSLLEADDDTGNDNNAGDDNKTDTTADTGNDNAEADNKTDDTATDNNADDNKEDDNKTEDQNDDTNDDDLKVDDLPPVDGDNGDGADDTSGSTDTGSTGSTGATNTVEVDKDSLKAKDKELFDTLDKNEQKIKIKELKKLYSDLYSNCNVLTTKINDIAIEFENNYEQFQRAINALFELKSNISFYLLNLYDTKSYFENDLMYNKYLIILNGVKNVIDDIEKQQNDDIQGK